MATTRKNPYKRQEFTALESRLAAVSREMTESSLARRIVLLEERKRILAAMKRKEVKAMAQLDAKSWQVEIAHRCANGKARHGVQTQRAVRRVPAAA